MSIESMTRVLLHSRAKGTAKVVLLGIANHDGDGGAWPAIDTLARYANADRRTVQRTIRDLVAMGELVVFDQDGGTRATRADRRPNRYEIRVTERTDLDGAASVSPRNGAAFSTPRGGTGVANGAAPTPPEPSLNHPEPSKDSSPLTAFAEFWSVYPRRTGKAAAVKAFAKALRAAPADDIIAGARRLAADPNLPDEGFIPHASTWLNQERWDDPPYPPRTDRRPTTDDRVRDGLDLAARLAAQESQGALAIGGGW